MLPKLYICKIKRFSMATTKFFLQSKKENSQIYMRLSLGRGKIWKRKIGITIDYKEWSSSKGQPKPNTEVNKNLINKLKKLESFVFDKLNTNVIDEIDGDWLQFQIDLFFDRISESEKSDFVSDAIDDYINIAPTLRNQKGGVGLSKNRIKNLKAFREIYNEFEKNKRKRYKVKQIDFNFRDTFLDYLLNLKLYAKSYALKKLGDLKTVCFHAELYGIETSPQLKKIATGKEQKELPQFLSIEELSRIKNLNLTSKALINARKWFILGCSIG